MSAAFVSNAGEIGVLHRAFADATKRQFALVAQNHSLYLLQLARELSSGNLWGGTVPTNAQIAAAGYPYAKRFPVNSAPSPDYIINIQTGEFLKAWKSLATLQSGAWVIVCWNDSTYAKYMAGTRLMRKRPITDEIDDRSFVQLRAKVTAALIQNAATYSTGSSAYQTRGNGLLFAIYIGASAGVRTLRDAI
jgi:hypothetical protein